jgi:hypothetical protein
MIIKKFIDSVDNINSRLFDIFYTVPLRLYLSQFIDNKFLKYYLFIEGVFVILFNSYNYLRYNKGNSKPQIHRLYNICVMYPIHIYIMLSSQFTNIQLFLFITITLPGFIYNTYNYIHY